MRAATNISDGLPPPRRYAAVAAVSLGGIVTAVDSSIANIALPTLARDLHVQPSAAVLVIIVYQLVLMMTLLPFSALGQRVGYRVTFVTGLLLFVAATALCFVAHSLSALAAARALQALGCSAVLSVSSAMVRLIYPLSRLGRGLSLNTVVQASAASFAPTIGGVMLTWARWPWLFAIGAPFGLLAMLIGRKTLPENQTHHEPYNVVSALMCAATFGSMVLGLENAIGGDSRLLAGGFVALAVGIGYKYVQRERRQSQPVLPVDLLRIREIALPCVGSLAAYLGLSVMMVGLPFRLQQQFHFSPAAAGAVLAPLPLMSMVIAPTSGLMSDRVHAGVLGGIGMGIGFVGMLCLAWLPAAPTQFDILWRVALCGAGFGMFFSPNARQIVGAAPRARAAAAGALFSTIRGGGQTLGATAIAALLAAGLGSGPAPGFIAAGFTLVAAYCSVSVLRRGRPAG